MASSGEGDAGTSQRRRDAIAGLSHADPAKALVMKSISRLVADGQADWRRLDTGEIRLCFRTGETFLLAATAIIRLA